jgi:FkbM family methyltransferase
LLLGRGKFNSYSQFGEDMVVKSLLRNIRSGTYADVGCYDPVLYSNTYYFYKKGWSGINIDPNPDLASRYHLLRPRDTFVCTGIGNGEASYQPQADGAYNKFEKGSGMQLTKLSEIFKDLKKVDFLNIDVEGMEMDVLTSHDWKVTPTVIAVEHEKFDPNNPSASEVYNLLRSKGYSLKGLCNLTLIWKRDAAL